MKSSNEQVQFMIAEIQSFYLNERNENITTSEAEKLLEFFKEAIAPFLYNAILNDVIQLIELQCDRLEEEIVNLEKPIMLNRMKIN